MRVDWLWRDQVESAEMAASPRLASRDVLGQARAWGWPFALGAAALVVAGVVGMVLVPATRREVEAVSADADSATRQASRPADNGVAGHAIDSGPERFLAAFPAADARQARVATLLELAGHHGLEIRRSEFQLGKDKESGLLRYSVTMPLTGSYAQLRGFVEDALACDAALSLDRLRLRRASPGASLVEADLTWSFYMRPGRPTGPRDAP